MLVPSIAHTLHESTNSRPPLRGDQCSLIVPLWYHYGATGHQHSPIQLALVIGNKSLMVNRSPTAQHNSPLEVDQSPLFASDRPYSPTLTFDDHVTITDAIYIQAAHCSSSLQTTTMPLALC